MFKCCLLFAKYNAHTALYVDAVKCFWSVAFLIRCESVTIFLKRFINCTTLCNKVEIVIFLHNIIRFIKLIIYINYYIGVEN